MANGMNYNGVEPKCGCLVNPGHGPTGHLGGADWATRCGLFRGPSMPFLPPSLKKAGKACGEGGLAVCSPDTPIGVWQLPFFLSLAVGDTTEILTLPTEGRLIAWEVTRVRDAAGADAINDLTVASWRSQSVRQTYPGLGRDSTWPDPGAVPVPAREFSSAAILDGRNRLPSWVSRVDLDGNNDALTQVLTNSNAGILRVEGFQWIAYPEG